MIELCCEYLPVWCIWLYVLIISRPCFRVNPHSIFAWMSRNSLLETGVISEVWVTAKGLEPTTKCSQMYCTYKYSQHSSVIWLVWLNGWVFIYKLSGCGFESCCSHISFRYCTCLEQGVSWDSGEYRVLIHSETHMWHDKNIQSNALYRLVLKNTVQSFGQFCYMVECSFTN